MRYCTRDNKIPWCRFTVSGRWTAERLRGGRPTQRRNPFLERRMTHEQAPEATSRRTADAQSGEVGNRKRLAVRALQTLQRGDHVVAPGEVRASRFGLVFLVLCL